MAEPTRGLLDTSVVIDHDMIDPALLPDESAITAVTLAELAAGPHATENKDERARRQDRLQWATPPGIRCLSMRIRNVCTLGSLLRRGQPDNLAAHASRTCSSPQRLRQMDCRSTRATPQ